MSEYPVLYFIGCAVGCLILFVPLCVILFWIIAWVGTLLTDFVTITFKELKKVFSCR